MFKTVYLLNLFFLFFFTSKSQYYSALLFCDLFMG